MQIVHIQLFSNTGYYRYFKIFTLVCSVYNEYKTYNLCIIFGQFIPIVTISSMKLKVIFTYTASFSSCLSGIFEIFQNFPYVWRRRNAANCFNPRTLHRTRTKFSSKSHEVLSKHILVCINLNAVTLRSL